MWVGSGSESIVVSARRILGLGDWERLGDGRTPPTVTDLRLLLTSARRCPQVGIGKASAHPRRARDHAESVVRARSL